MLPYIGLRDQLPFLLTAPQRDSNCATRLRARVAKVLRADKGVSMITTPNGRAKKIEVQSSSCFPSRVLPPGIAM